MNVERLHAVLEAVRDEIDQQGLANELTSLVSSLQNQINQPTDANHQRAVAAALSKLRTKLGAAPSDRMSPAWYQILEDVGLDDVIGARLLDRVNEAFSQNEITPAVVLDELQKILQSVQAAKKVTHQLVTGMAQLGLGKERLQAGEAEVGLMIPRDAIDSELGQLADELNEFDLLLRTTSQAVGEESDRFTVRTISSSDFSVYADLAIETGAFLAVAVERLIAAYKKILEIRKLRQELKAQDVPDAKLKGISEHADSQMAQAINLVLEEVFDERCKVSDQGRKNELRVLLRSCLVKLARRIDRGYNVEVNVEPPTAISDNGDEEEVETAHHTMALVKEIEDARPTLEFMRLEGEPILHLPEASTDSPPKPAAKRTRK